MPAFFIWCAGRDSNPRSPKTMDLQSTAFDHSATDAYGLERLQKILEIKIYGNLISFCIKRGFIIFYT